MRIGGPMLSAVLPAAREYVPTQDTAQETIAIHRGENVYFETGDSSKVLVFKTEEFCIQSETSSFVFTSKDSSETKVMSVSMDSIRICKNVDSVEKKNAGVAGAAFVVGTMIAGAVIWATGPGGIASLLELLFAPAVGGGASSIFSTSKTDVCTDYYTPAEMTVFAEEHSCKVP